LEQTCCGIFLAVSWQLNLTFSFHGKEIDPEKDTDDRIRQVDITKN
jgi:hypothetical protein